MSHCVRGVPRDIVLCLVDRLKLDIFVETGTLIGYSAKWASRHFSWVLTVEFFDKYYELAVNNLLSCENVFPVKNDSMFFLEHMRQSWDGHCSPLFWLDAHWSREAQYGRPEQETNVLEEVKNINQWQSLHAIIVDDANKFGTPRWPTRAEIILALSDNNRRTVREVYDTFVATPNISIEGNIYEIKSAYVAPIKGI